LPTTTPSGETGVTMSCSSVPRSRSRTMANAARMVPENASRMAIRPGISRLALRESGLNSITGCGSRGGAASRARVIASSSEWVSAMPVAADRVCDETEESEPSISTRNSALSPLRRRRANSGGISNPTWACPATISCRSAARESTLRTTAKSRVLTRSATSSRLSTVFD
jgi:hypothetical protein